MDREGLDEDLRKKVLREWLYYNCITTRVASLPLFRMKTVNLNAFSLLPLSSCYDFLAIREA